MKKSMFLVPAGAALAAGALLVGQALPGSAAVSTRPVTAAPAAAPAAAAVSSIAGASGVRNVKTLNLETAKRLATVALNNCARRGYAVTVVVVDTDGVEIVVLRGDGTMGASVATSKGKAYASVGFRTPSGTLGEAAQNNPGLLTVPGFVLLGGGQPVVSDGTVVAGVGVGGAPSGAIDDQCAKAGLAAIAGAL